MPFGLSVLGVKILAGLALVAALLLGYGLWSAHEQSIGAAIVRADNAQKALAGERAARVESDRRVAAQQENLHEDERFAAARAADAAGLDAVVGRLHDDAARGRLGPVNPAASAAGPAASVPTAPVVSADLYLRAVDAAAALAKYADCLRGVSELCARDYDSLKP